MNILYSTDCPKCKVLERELSSKGIDFIIDHDFDRISEAAKKKNCMNMPLYESDGKIYTFEEARKLLTGDNT